MNRKIFMTGLILLIIGMNSFGQTGIIPGNSILGVALELSLNEKEELIAVVDVTLSDSCVNIMLSEKPFYDENIKTYHIRMDFIQPVLKDVMCFQVVTSFRKSYNLGKQAPGTYTVEVAGEAIETIKIPATELLCGDYNEDGVVNIIDSLKIAQDYVGYPDGNEILGDVNSNGRCDIVDALIIAQYYVSGDKSLLNCDFSR